MHFASSDQIVGQSDLLPSYEKCEHDATRNRSTMARFKSVYGEMRSFFVQQVNLN
jgi:hypothetical protein